MLSPAVAEANPVFTPMAMPSVRRSAATRYVVGLNAAVDLIVPAVQLLEALGVAPGAAAQHDELGT